ncbi:hypothetical protein FB451DRAFT_694833 [Mycena latifolia]|nr:hypothetical protein FB451DRAFT_694833 [Mycena latifolia]
MSVMPGIYSITNAKAAIALDLLNGSSEHSTKIQARKEVNLDDSTLLSQLWLVERTQRKGVESYSIRNLCSGTYMDLVNGDPRNGAAVGGCPAGGDPVYKTNVNQEWVLIRFGVFYRLKSVAAGTFLNLEGGKDEDGTKIECWENEEGTADQRWSLNRVSATHDEIIAALQRSPYRLSDFKRYPVDSIYLVVNQPLLKGIWNQSGLRANHCRTQIFDSDDFALGFKAFVAKWGNDNIKADNLTLLCGLIVGQSIVKSEDEKHTYHAFNWTLTDDRTTILFFEPQNGQISATSEYTAVWGTY